MTLPFSFFAFHGNGVSFSSDAFSPYPSPNNNDSIIAKIFPSIDLPHHEIKRKIGNLINIIKK
jgi:hypothetical protein